MLMFALSACHTSEVKLVITEALQKKDTVSLGDTIKKNFFIVNQTKSKVNIFRIIASCGCTVVSDIKEKYITKGDSIMITVKYTPEQIDSGDVSKTIVLYTDANPKLYDVSIKAYVSKHRQ